MENRETKGEGTKKLAKEERLIIRIVGFFLIFYGFISFIDPSRYGIGLASPYSTLFSLFIIIVGLFLSVKIGGTHDH